MSTMTTAPMTLHFCPWPEGTEVGAYLRISETMVFESTPPGQTPVEEVFVAEGQVTFATLGVGDYWAVGQMPDGRYRYVSFRQQPDPPGTQGPPGPPGPQGIQGPAGALPVGGATGTWLRKNSSTNGDAGWVDSGAVILNLGVPSDAGGSNGDLTIDTTGRIYYKTSGTWKLLRPYLEMGQTLPAAPVQGQEFLLQVVCVGFPNYVYWHLRWETYAPEDRWEFIGGEPIRIKHTSGGDFVAASTNTALQIDNIWLECNLPYNGFYEVTYLAGGFGVTSGASIATVEIQRMVEAGATYTAGVGTAEQNAKAEYTAGAAGTYLPFNLTTVMDLRGKGAPYRDPPVICPTLQRASGGTWTLRTPRNLIVRPIYLIP